VEVGRSVDGDRTWGGGRSLGSREGGAGRGEQGRHGESVTGARQGEERVTGGQDGGPSKGWGLITGEYVCSSEDRVETMSEGRGVTDLKKERGEGGGTGGKQIWYRRGTGLRTGEDRPGDRGKEV
jgi:hypothetical protein